MNKAIYTCKLLCAVLAILCVQGLCCPMIAQQASGGPLSAELVFGHQRSNFQLSLNRQLGEHFRVNSITIATAPYDKEKASTELISINSLVYPITKKIGLSAGIQYHFLKGFIPNNAIHLNHATPNLVLTLTPYMHYLPTRNVETLAMAEYQPHLTNTTKLYARVTVLYNYNFSRTFNERYFAQCRLGISKSICAFGLAYNYDYYGATKQDLSNFGLFVRAKL